jgi:two-component system, OmpR family, sensor histidine kinase TctE
MASNSSIPSQSVQSGDTPTRQETTLGSMRAQLLRWLLLPLIGLVALNTYSAYYNAVDAANAAYDRSLLTSARTIADRLRVEGGKVLVDVPYVALDMFEADIKGQIFYKVTGLNGESLSGFDDFPPLKQDVARSDAYPALVRFYDESYHSVPLRVAALYQPIFDGKVYGAALVQIGETLHSRRALTNKILFDTLLRQVLLVACAGVIIVVAVRSAFRPLNHLRLDLERRSPTDLSKLSSQFAHREIKPLIHAVNHYISRLRSLINGQKRFIADASHQLRTPLTVLRTQAELALRQTDLASAQDIIRAFHANTDRTIRLANQLLSRARADHASVANAFSCVDLAAIVQEVCLEIADIAVKKRIDLAFENDEPLIVEGDPLLLRELVTNIVENAVRYTPDKGRVIARVFPRGAGVVFEVEDTGPGIAPSQRDRVFEPFYRLAHEERHGAGLGLAIVGDIAKAHNGVITLSDGVDGKGLLFALYIERSNSRSNEKST